MPKLQVVSTKSNLDMLVKNANEKYDIIVIVIGSKTSFLGKDDDNISNNKNTI